MYQETSRLFASPITRRRLFQLAAGGVVAAGSVLAASKFTEINPLFSKLKLDSNNDPEHNRLMTEDWLNRHPINIVQTLYVKDSQDIVNHQLALLGNSTLFVSDLDPSSKQYNPWQLLANLPIEQAKTIASSNDGKLVVIGGATKSQLYEKNPPDDHYHMFKSREYELWVIAQTLQGRQDYWDKVNPSYPYQAPAILLSKDGGKSFREITHGVKRGIVNFAKSIGDFKFLLNFVEDSKSYSPIESADNKVAIFDAMNQQIDFIEEYKSENTMLYDVLKSSGNESLIDVYSHELREAHSYSDHPDYYYYSPPPPRYYISQTKIDLSLNKRILTRDLFYAQDPIGNIFVEERESNLDGVYFLTGTNFKHILHFDYTTWNVPASINLSTIDYSTCSQESFINGRINPQTDLEFHGVTKHASRIWVAGIYKDSQVKGAEVLRPLIISWPSDSDPTKLQPAIYAPNLELHFPNDKAKKGFKINFQPLTLSQGKNVLNVVFPYLGIVSMSLDKKGGPLEAQMEFPNKGLV